MRDTVADRERLIAYLRRVTMMEGFDRAASISNDEFAERWEPIIDVFDAEGVRFALEVHPTEIAYDFVTTQKTLDAIGRRPGFGINLDPSHFAHQFLDTAAFAIEFAYGAIGEAEYAVLDAVVARKEADELSAS